MNSSFLLLSSDGLTVVSFFLFYAAVGLVSYRLLMPRLSPAARRLAAGIFLTQVLVAIVALKIQPETSFERWLWDFEEEWNVPATLASVQMALVGGVAILAAWLDRARPAWQRAYFVGIGLLYLCFALDEYYAVHEYIEDWPRVYTVLGALAVAATVAVARHTSRKVRLWHISLLIGIAISAIGAMVFNFIPDTCINAELLGFTACMDFLFLGESLELLGTWLTLVAVLGSYVAAEPAPRPRVGRVLYLLPVLWILLLTFDPIALRLELRFLAQPTAIVHEQNVRLHGYRLENRGDSLFALLYASASHREYSGLGYSIHLVDQDTGDSFAQRDLHAGRIVHLKVDPDFIHVFRQRMNVEIPQETPVNRALWIVLTVWRRQDGASVRQRVVASDLHQLDETQIVLGELALPAASESGSASSIVPLAIFDNGLTLSSADVPDRARPGESLEITFAWRSDVAGQEDHAQFLHLGHEESGEWWVYDQQPLGPRLPTRLWYSGLVDSEVWKVPLPADLAPGRYNVFTGLYRTRDRERIPVSDVDGTPWVDARVPLGSLYIE